MLNLIAVAAAIATLLRTCFGQFPASPSYSNIIRSALDPNVILSYNTPPPGTCTTVFTEQKQYTGYVHLPPATLEPVGQNYSINAFFWFVEARERPETAPLTIWLNGGPGSSSMIGFFQENGPCEVAQLADGSYGTLARPWGWDRSSNMLFLDQPGQVGLSYDTATNLSYDLMHDSFSFPTERPDDMPSYAFLNGTFSSGNRYNTANTTRIAAITTWHFLQAFLSTFPQYNPGVVPNATEVSATGVHLFAESYGGIYGPAFASFFSQQNRAREANAISPTDSLEIRLESLGIINGYIDPPIQTEHLLYFGNSNTYGVKVFSDADTLKGLSDFRTPGGCHDLVRECRDGVTTLDPTGEGDVFALNTLCQTASTECQKPWSMAVASGRDIYDIRQKEPVAFPSMAYLEYLNSAEVQEAIGTGINFTRSSKAVFNAFAQTGDAVREDQISSLAELLSLGIRVALIYGDADFICSWNGGEAVSSAISARLPSYAPFASTGYAPIVVNDSYVGGVVRQFGNLSFSRVYDAGHLVPTYQPETAFSIFARTLAGTSISTGESIDRSTYSTTGPPNSTYKNKVPPQPKPTCWIRAIADSCSEKERKMMHDGKGVVLHGVLYRDKDDYKPPSTQIIAGKPGMPPRPALVQTGETLETNLTVVPTGVYVATGTPTALSGGVKALTAPRLPLGVVALASVVRCLCLC